MARRSPAAALLLSVLLLLLVACTSTSTSTSTSSTKANQPIAFVGRAAQQSNGPAPKVTAAQACGSDTESYLLEMLHTPPSNLKVLHEWGDIVPGGKEVMVVGTVDTTHLGPTDLPMSHPYGDDLSMNVTVDPDFRPFSLHLGTQESETGPNQIHVEISSGFIPHGPRPPSATADQAQTWRQLSDFNLTGFQDGFDKPAIGDRIAIMGRWIIDCGHANFMSELHPMTFLAWAHQAGTTTTVHAYMNPFRDTELYGDTADRAKAKPFPPYFIDQIVGLVTGQSDRLHSRELVEANAKSPAPWRVCAPAGGGKATMRLDVAHRPDFSFNVAFDKRTGCADVTSRYDPGYRAAEPVLRDCALPWEYLDAAASGALSGSVKVLPIIEGYVPPAVRSLVERDPTTSCADALAGPAVSATPEGQRVRSDGNQPFPFYGVLTLARS